MTDDESADAARVAELAATVDGLTSELVDLQERVRELEAKLEGAETDDAIPDESKTVEEMFAEADSGTESTGQGSGAAAEQGLEDVETIGDDILVG